MGRIMHHRKWLLAAPAAISTPAPPAPPRAPQGQTKNKTKDTEPTRTQGGGGDLEGYNPNDPTPAPKMPDGKPDFSGVWTLMGGNVSQDPIPPFAPGGAERWKVDLDPNKDDPS